MHRSTDCERMRQSVSLRLDGELSDAGERRLARHLAHCDACARFARSLTALTEALRHANRHTRSGRSDLAQSRAGGPTSSADDLNDAGAPTA